MSSAMGKIGIFLKGLTPEQQADVADAVKDYIELRGFHRPNGGASHPAARRK